MTVIRMTASLDGPRDIERDLPDGWWEQSPEWREAWLASMQRELAEMLTGNTIECSTGPYSREFLTAATGLDDPDWPEDERAGDGGA